MSIAIELAVLALASWPLFRLLSIPPVRREFTGIAWALVGIAIAYAGGLAAIAFLAPVVLHPLAALAAAAVAAERWRARPGYGTKRGMPPGSLGLFPRGPWVDDRFYRKQADRWGAIFKTSLQYRPCVCLLGAPLGIELLRDHAEDLEAPRVRFNRFIPKGFLRYMEPEDHPAYKKMFREAFFSPVFERNRESNREIVRRGLARLAHRSAAHPKHGVSPRPSLREIVFELLVAAFFGVGGDDEAFTWLERRYESLDLRKESLVPDARDRAALADVEAWVRTRGREMQRTAERGGSPPACFLAFLATAHPEALDDETVLGNLVYALTIGRADLTALLTWIVKMLGDAPAWRVRLGEAARTEPEGRALELATCIVRETLRLEQSEYVYRRAKRDIEFRGFKIRRGWRIRVLIREGHRDPERFADPDRFDPARWLGPGDPGRHFHPFGIDAHACIGSRVTEQVARLVLTELGRAYDWRVVSDGPREYGWAHWQPSSKLRISLVPAGEPGPAPDRLPEDGARGA